ncbi:MAG TPA: class I SAM-dependent methyltransferase [Verrucomicrobiae bacterium]|nr:class I SAM-dependent methyltransferase [Verrucomicrobiae bacterium]
MSASVPQAFDEKKLHDFVMRAVGEMGAAMNAVLIVVGDKLGLYKAMAGAGPVTPAELAAKTGTTERYVREWLSAQAAGGFVTYDATSGKFALPPEQAMALADEQSPVFLPGFFQILSACFKDEPRISEAFRTGKGVGWHEHDHALFAGTERFFRPNYRAHLIGEWIPALTDAEAKLKTGAKVADVGCGLGTSTILMARAYPKSTFVGFDYHPASIEAAKEAAAKAGVSDRVQFEVARAKDFPGKDFDFVAFFDCLHDMGDPEGAARHVRSTLRPDGAWMIVEPFAHDKLEDNLNPIGRVFYGASTMLCTPASLSQEVGLGLGAQAGEGRLTKILKSAGFTRVRRAAETPFNIVLEARP